MKAGNKNNVLEGIKKEQLKRRVFTLEFKAEVAGRRAVSPEQAGISRLKAELSRSKMEVAILMARGHPEKAAAYFAKDIL